MGWVAAVVFIVIVVVLIALAMKLYDDATS